MSVQVFPTGMKSIPLEKRAGKGAIRLEHGDLTAMAVDAFVFYAREDLALGTGYGTAIQMRGGVAIKKELEKIGRVQMGEATITGAGALNAKHIIHACGPKFQEPELEKKLDQCMKSALRVAKDNAIKTLAFPPMGAGFYGVPLDLSAKVMFDNIKAHLEGETSIEKVIVVVVDYRDYVPFKARLDQI
jgi:O-acetyl-ADP-ribose deacetylase